jgi:hypothetical protein
MNHEEGALKGAWRGVLYPPQDGQPGRGGLQVFDPAFGWRAMTEAEEGALGWDVTLSSHGLTLHRKGRG